MNDRKDQSIGTDGRKARRHGIAEAEREGSIYRLTLHQRICDSLLTNMFIIHALEVVKEVTEYTSSMDRSKVHSQHQLLPVQMTWEKSPCSDRGSPAPPRLKCNTPFGIQLHAIERMMIALKIVYPSHSVDSPDMP